MSNAEQDSTGAAEYQQSRETGNRSGIIGEDFGGNEGLRIAIVGSHRFSVFQLNKVRILLQQNWPAIALLALTRYTSAA